MPSDDAWIHELHERIDRGRTFGRHPLWQRIAEGGVSRAQLGLFSVQFFLQVREFPRAVSGLHARCPDTGERAALAESIYEEETGRISGCNISHPELFIRFGEAAGASRREMEEGVPLPGTAALTDWFELATTQRSFCEGAAAITLAAEGQVPGAFGDFARALEKSYGLSREAVAFWDIHDEADREHSDVGDSIVVRLVKGVDEQARIVAAVDRSLECWWSFFDDIERAVDALGPRP